MKKSQYKNYNKKSKYRNYNIDDQLDKTFFDKLFFRIFLSSVILLLIVGLDKVCYKLNLNINIKNEFTENINIIKLIKGLNNTVIKFIDDDRIKEVYESDFYTDVTYYNGINQVKLIDSNSVNNLVSGYVVKIEKNGSLYNVIIKGIDGYEYKFNGLTNIDVNLYQYVEANKIIGLASYDEIYAIYFFDLVISDKKGVYSYYENAN